MHDHRRNRTPGDLVGRHPFEGRWHDAYKEEMRRRRVGTTERVVAALAASDIEDRVVVNASGVVYHGDCGEELVSESRLPDPDAFVARPAI
jgi:NAD dependent epimerase/dehydratase family enzyme